MILFYVTYMHALLSGWDDHKRFFLSRSPIQRNVKIINQNLGDVADSGHTIIHSSITSPSSGFTVQYNFCLFSAVVKSPHQESNWYEMHFIVSMRNARELLFYPLFFLVLHLAWRLGVPASDRGWGWIESIMSSRGDYQALATTTALAVFSSLVTWSVNHHVSFLLPGK